MSTVILVPVLNRPHRVAPLLADIEAATPESHRVLFMVEDGDTAERAAIDDAGADHLVVHRSQRSYARKINAGYRATDEPLIFCGADDIRPHPGWLSAAIARLSDTVHVVGTNDLCNPRVTAGQHATHNLMTRAYADDWGTIDMRGAVMHDAYPHDYCDDELVQTAMARHAWAFAADSIVEHLHPWAGKAESDDTYRLGRQYRRSGQRIFRRRQHLWEAA